MVTFKETQLCMEHYFDPKSNRHFLNGSTSVLHCHHYATLYTQLAMDAKETALLAAVVEDTFFKVLKNYFEKNQIKGLQEKIVLACQYFSAVGLGKMEIVFAGDFSGQVRMLNSHVDDGWLKKWGKFDRPINYIGCGYIAALFSLVFDLPVRSFSVIERKSIVMGEQESLFNVERI